MHHPLLSGRRLGFCLLLFTAPFAAQADTITLAPTEDTYVAELYPSTPRYEDAGRVTIMQFMSPRADSYFKFDLSSIPSSQTIVGATLWLYQTTDGNAPYGPQGTSLYRMDGNNWSQTTLAWGNQPSFTTSLFGTSNDGGLHTGWSSWTWSATAADPTLDTTPADPILSLFLAEGSSADQTHVWLGSNYTSYSDVLATYGSGKAPYLEITTRTAPSPIPEPGNLALVAAGLGALILAVRRQKS